VKEKMAVGAEGIMRGFYLQLADLAQIYPENLSVRTKK
jgi:hypothetical protein